MPEMTYLQAVNAALDRALAESPQVVVFGEDLGAPGGVFGQTKGLAEKYGDRVFNTPISEAAILGSAIGMAQHGMRPVAEIMWSDFSLVALDQIVNQAANVRYVSNGAMSAPLTIRMQQGVTPGSCAQHSQNLEAIFAHVPGIRVCMPATPQDAFDMLLGAIWSDDPTVVIENRRMYSSIRAEVAIDHAIPPSRGSSVRRSGNDATVVTWGRMVWECLDAAEELAGQDVETEVVDLRWLNPLDIETVLRSIEKTSRILIVHEANLTGGFGAEIAARVAESGLFLLDAPVQRLGLPDLRVPAAPHLQEAIVPNAESIARSVAHLVGT